MLDFDENKRELEELNTKFLSLENTIGKAEDLEKKLKELEEKTLAERFLEWYETSKYSFTWY